MALREQQQRMRAEQKLAKEQARRLTGAVEPLGNHQHSILEIALKNDVNKIRSMPTLADRAVYKRDHFLPKWLPYVHDYFNKKEQYQNEIIGYCIVYLFDVGDLTQALELSQLAIDDGQQPPAIIKSTLTTFVARQVFDFTEKMATAGQSFEPYFSQTFKNVATQWKLHEKIQAKWYKLAGNLLITSNGKAHPASNNDPERLTFAVQLFNRAYQLDHRVGVTTAIERCIMRLKKLASFGIELNHTQLKNKEASKEPQPVRGLTLDKTDINVSRIIELLNAPPLSFDEIKEKYHLKNIKQEAEKGEENA
ncbi:phage terminase small subunit [Pasteurella skyensis]|uniref:Phage terminase small subunit n=1 Tax=Phocoenobacter skyensis TaxID=97481 RepID=A0AAJ6P1I6_9PAST|nr:phage terminase small subunit [Pasteurella skyensis]MDP8173673.1 phage terminase small subunit [Pasteurella skyensis]MDP8178041.1 phage terminase small subunit [Pasteurella skyensis]